MRRLDSLAALNIVLSWLSSPGEAQTLPEILSPCTRSPPCFTSVHTAAAASRSPSGTGPTYLAIVYVYLAFSPFLTANVVSPPITRPNTVRRLPQSQTRLQALSQMARDPYYSIVIVAALLVCFVVRRRNRRQRRMLHEVMNQSWGARLAARHSVVGSVDSKDEEVVGTTFSRDTRRPSRAPSISRSTASTSKKTSRSNHLPRNSSKARYSSRPTRASFETEDFELSSWRTSTPFRPSSSSPTTVLPPTVIGTLHDESDAPKPGDGLVTMGQGIVAATASAAGADADETVAANVRGALAEGAGTRRKLGLKDEERAGRSQGPSALLTPTAHPRGVRDKLGSGDMPPAYEYVRWWFKVGVDIRSIRYNRSQTLAHGKYLGRAGCSTISASVETLLPDFS